MEQRTVKAEELIKWAETNFHSIKGINMKIEDLDTCCWKCGMYYDLNDEADEGLCASIVRCEISDDEHPSRFKMLCPNCSGTVPRYDRDTILGYILTRSKGVNALFYSSKSYWGFDFDHFDPTDRFQSQTYGVFSKMIKSYLEKLSESTGIVRDYYILYAEEDVAGKHNSPESIIQRYFYSQPSYDEEGEYDLIIDDLFTFDENLVGVNFHWSDWAIRAMEEW